MCLIYLLPNGRNKGWFAELLKGSHTGNIEQEESLIYASYRRPAFLAGVRQKTAECGDRGRCRSRCRSTCCAVASSCQARRLRWVVAVRHSHSVILLFATGFLISRGSGSHPSGRYSVEKNLSHPPNTIPAEHIVRPSCVNQTRYLLASL